MFVLASATTGEPSVSGERLTGLPVRAVTEDASPRGGVTFALWEPPLLVIAGQLADDAQAVRPPGLAAQGVCPSPRAGDEGVDRLARDDQAVRRPAPARDGGPLRRSTLTETADLLADTITEGVRTLAFIRSRRGAEVVATATRRALREAVPELAGRVAAYRAGYLREERRELERQLLDGRLLGLATTNALELGIDVAGLDAVLLAGYPGTSRRSGSRRGGPAVRAGTRSVSWWRATTRSIRTWSITPKRFSVAGWRPPCSIRPTLM